MQKKHTPPLNSFVRYSSIAFQMGITVFAGAYGGVKLDEYFQLSFPVFTLTLTIFSVGVAMYFAIKDFMK